MKISENRRNKVEKSNQRRKRDNIKKYLTGKIHFAVKIFLT